MSFCASFLSLSFPFLGTATFSMSALQRQHRLLQQTKLLQSYRMLWMITSTRRPDSSSGTRTPNCMSSQQITLEWMVLLNSRSLTSSTRANAFSKYFVAASTLRTGCAITVCLWNHSIQHTWRSTRLRACRSMPTSGSWAHTRRSKEPTTSHCHLWKNPRIRSRPTAALDIHHGPPVSAQSVNPVPSHCNVR